MLLLFSLSLISVGQVIKVPQSRYLSIKNLSPSCLSVEKDMLRNKIVITGLSHCLGKLEVIARKNGKKEVLKIRVMQKPIRSTQKNIEGWK